MTRANAIDPSEILERFASGYVNLYALWKDPAHRPHGVEVSTPAHTPIEPHVPPDLRRLLDEHGTPPGDIAFVKYLKTEDGAPRVLIEDEEPLPPEHEIVTLSRSVTIAARDAAHVVTELFVARVRSRSPDG